MFVGVRSSLPSSGIREFSTQRPRHHSRLHLGFAGGELAAPQIHCSSIGVVDIEAVVSVWSMIVAGCWHMHRIETSVCLQSPRPSCFALCARFFLHDLASRHFSCSILCVYTLATLIQGHLAIAKRLCRGERTILSIFACHFQGYVDIFDVCE